MNDDGGSLPWQFFGYQSPAGGRPVQEWFDGLLPEEKDETLDTLSYLQQLPLKSWAKPEYAPLGDGLSEIRFKVNALNETVRIYGFFWPPLPKKAERIAGTKHYSSYTLLLGSDKKVKNDKASKSEAIKRMNKIKRTEATTHVFKFS